MPDARIKEDSTNNNDRKIQRWGIKNKGADEMVSVKRRRRVLMWTHLMWVVLIKWPH